MVEHEMPRTRLEQLLRQRHVTLEEFRKNYQRAADGTAISERQAYRWTVGELRGLPYPQAQATLEEMVGEPVTRLLGPPYGIGALQPIRGHHGAAPQRGTARTDWAGQVIVMSAERARDFRTRIEASNVGTETLPQLIDDLHRLVVAYEHQPLPTLLGDLVDTQDRAFVLLEGRQRPEHTRELYLLAGIACGLMAKASHDLGAAHDAMTQARTSYACADNAGHDGLRAWTRGLQALITYWSGRLEESVRYAQSGAEAAARSHGTAGVWLASNEARALAALNRLDDAHAALARAAHARDRVQPDELDNLGGVAGTRSALAVARVFRGEIDGAVEALAPVLELPVAKRIHGIVTSVEHVRTALRSVENPGREVTDLAGAIKGWTAERLTLPA